MKPISLTIEGINSFCDRQTIDFDFDGLFCISGDTGSGKTTILDCIILALYGNGKRTSTLSDYINVQRQSAEVKLVFTATVDGESHKYEVTRTFKRAGNNKAKLVNLDTGMTLAEQTDNVNKAIEAMIELKREDFTQVVILEQGRFSKFLTAGKRERNDTVGNLFKLNKYKNLGPKFSQKKELVKKDLDGLQARINELSEVTASAIREKEKEIAAFKARAEQTSGEEAKISAELATLEEDKRKFDKCVAAEKELLEAENKGEKIALLMTELAAKLEEILSQINDMGAKKAACELIAAKGSALQSLLDEKNKRVESLETLIKEWREADGEAKTIDAKHKAAVAKSEALISSYDLLLNDICAIADFDKKDGQYDIFDVKSQADKLLMELKTLEDSFAECANSISEYDARVKSGNKEISTAMQMIGEAKGKCDLLKAEVESLKLTRDQERLQAAAHHIRQGLKIGDVCPVCGGTVLNVESHIEETETERILAQKEKELSEAEKCFNTLNNNLYSFTTRLDENNKALNELKKKKASISEKISLLKEKIKMPEKIDSLASLTAKACDVSAKSSVASSEASIEEQKLLSAVKRVEDIRKRGEAERSELNRLEEVIKQKLDVTEEELKQNKEKLDYYTAEVEKITALKTEVEGKRDGLIAESGANKANIERLRKETENKPEFDQSALEEKTKRQSELKKEKEELIAKIAWETKELEVLNKNLEIKRGFEQQKEAKKKEYDIYSEIFKLVSGDKFIEYIAEEYILQFTESASLVLSDITGGKYTLEYKAGDFYVKDFLSGGMERKVDTLSGGETFLASLSLAIAISREIAMFKTYEFLFLDEGFGTLDTGFIDTVVNALTTLSADTLVGLVTHRTELTERIFDKIIVLPSDGERGSRIIRSSV